MKDTLLGYLIQDDKADGPNSIRIDGKMYRPTRGRSLAGVMELCIEGLDICSSKDLEAKVAELEEEVSELQNEVGDLETKLGEIRDMADKIATISNP